jgi:hypothetical protein
MQVRFVVCIDIEADTLADAYKEMVGPLSRSFENFETTEEYYIGDASEPGDTAQLGEAINKYFFGDEKNLTAKERGVKAGS